MSRPPDRPFEIQVRPGAAGIVVTGEVDLHTAPLLTSTLNEAAGGPSGEIVLDLAQVSFIDSYGLAALLDARQLAMERGRTLVLGSPSNVVRRLLEVANLSDMFSIR